jgi:acyl transferase domain-containing protein/phosphopantetheinyl transferase (holo-ACP synthase)
VTERDVAIIGMGCLFPRAPDLATYWQNIRDGVDAITDVPAGRWDPCYYDPASSAPDRFYARRGGFIDDYAQFDAAAFGIMPVAAQGAEPDQLLALQVAVAAVGDAGYAERSFARERTSVIIGRGNYAGAGILRLINITRVAQQIVDTLHALVPDVSPERLSALKRDFQASCGAYGPATAIGLVPNLTASLIANRLDLGGSAYTVDAACASTLVAVDQACRELRSGDIDVAITGGVHLCHDTAFWSVFSQLGALSRSQQIRPFDRRADGLLIGEGIGMLVLKRLSDARKDSDRIYAVIRGTGVASDGRGVSMMTPRAEGQSLALTRAWKAAGLDPATVGLVEAHGTATAAGDAAELATLARIFGAVPANGERIPLGSVKSMIGHAMPAAGAAGLIKAVLAVHHGVRPPTLHCEEPSPALASTRFRTLQSAEPWEGRMRRAAVNAFGFGGINAHVIVDADGAAPARAFGRGGTATELRPLRTPSAATSAASIASLHAAVAVDTAASAAAPAATTEVHATTRALICAAPSQAALAAAVAAGRSGGEGTWRIAVMDPAPVRLETAKAVVAAGQARSGRDGIYFSPDGLLTQGGKLAFLFPGIEAELAPNVDDIARQLGMPAPDLEAGTLAFQGASVIALNGFLAKVASAVGLVPDVLAGHSIGEWSGMLASGMFEHASVADFISALQPEMLKIAEVTYVAVGAGAQRVQNLIADLPDVGISHDNCLHQSVLCGADARIEEVSARLRAERILFEILPFRSGFHSRAIAGHLDSYIANLQRLKPAKARVPLWSATTCAPYPTDPQEISALYARHLSEPVRFRELVLALYEHGVRVFVQIGSGSLAAFVDDVLVDKPHRAIALLAPRRSGLEQLRRACAALYVEGAPIDIWRIGLGEDRGPAPSTRTMSLALGVPLVELDLQPLAPSMRELPRVDATGDPLLAAFDATMREVFATHEAVRQALAAAPRVAARPAVPSERSDRLLVSVAAFPELRGHCLIPQPPRWPTLADWMPVVPLTMSLSLMMEAAHRLDPTRLPVAIEQVAAHTWLQAEPPVEVDITAKRSDGDKIRVNIGNYIDCVVTMAACFPDAPPSSVEPIGDLRPFPIADDAIYRDGWMFHGPEYQGVVSVDAFGANGMRATLRALPARGALLDAAGQLVGLWASVMTDRDRLVLPVRVDKVEFYGVPPASTDVVTCTVLARAIRRHEVCVDLDIRQGDRRYAFVSGWADWRFHTTDRLFDVMRQPGVRLLAEPHPGGFVVLRASEWPTSTRDFLLRRFLSTTEIDAKGGFKEAQKNPDWVNGRIAAKDAVRSFLFAAGVGPLYPVEITIKPDAAGRPRVHGPFAQDMRVSIAHKPGIACAIAAEGVDPGIDVEKIEPRGDGFAALAFSGDELRMLPADNRDEWLTRFWTAKEAAGKAMGTGLAGDPKKLRITEVSADRILVEGRWVNTGKIDEFAVAWTVQ